MIKLKNFELNGLIQEVDCQIVSQDHLHYFIKAQSGQFQLEQPEEQAGLGTLNNITRPVSLETYRTTDEYGSDVKAAEKAFFKRGGVHPKKTIGGWMHDVSEIEGFVPTTIEQGGCGIYLAEIYYQVDQTLDPNRPRPTLVHRQHICVEMNPDGEEHLKPDRRPEFRLVESGEKTKLVSSTEEIDLTPSQANCVKAINEKTDGQGTFKWTSVRTTLYGSTSNQSLKNDIFDRYNDKPGSVENRYAKLYELLPVPDYGKGFYLQKMLISTQEPDLDPTPG
jgi:hypothetical protein